MQILGLLLLGFVVWYGFIERDTHAISAFDTHALIMVLGGSFAAILISSKTITTLRTFTCLRELVPGVGTLGPGTDALDRERKELVALWLDGKRAQAVQLAQNSQFPAISRMLDLVLSRAPQEAIGATFMELQNEEMVRWQPAIANWELLAKLAPSFGMVGTITGMIQLFRTLGEDTNMGAAISLALLATLYGVAFGAGVAGPIGHYLRGLLDERIAALELCEKSVGELIARSARASAVGA